MGFFNLNQVCLGTESIVNLLFIVFSALLIHVGDTRAIYALGEEDPGRDGYYDEETPKDWVDILFIIVIAFHHSEYAFKFTDYSLSHIHIQQHTFAAKKDQDPANVKIKDLENVAKKLDTLNSEESTKSLIGGVMDDVLSVFTTESDGKSARRAIHNRVCCCISWSPRYFTWQRTYIIRSFLKFYLCVSCLLAMVLYVEFFMNLFVEFLITCIVHYSDLYVFALIVVPILLFVCDVLIRLAWQAVLVSWSLNCDRNGDLEAMDSQVGITALRSQLVSSKRLLYTFTNDARNNYNYDLYNDEQDAIVEDKKKEKEEEQQKQIEIELQAATGAGAKDGVKAKAQRALSVTVGVVVDTVSDVADTVTDAGYSVVSTLTPETPDVIVKTQTQLSREKQSELIKAADKEEYRAKMGDYFMATCWRLGFFFYTMIAAFLAAWSVDVEVAVTGFFWQLVMRYCVLGGVVWTVVYYVGAFFVAVTSRYRSWYLIHSKIPRYKLFFLIDAHDYETDNRAWTRAKFCIMFTSFSTFVIMVTVSYIYIDENWSSFVHFLGIVFALYYFINLFMACKPYALVALWTDAIPPPGRNYMAHQIAADTLKEKGMIEHALKSRKDVYLGTVSYDEDNDYNKDDNEEQLEQQIELNGADDNMDDDDNKEQQDQVIEEKHSSALQTDANDVKETDVVSVASEGHDKENRPHMETLKDMKSKKKKGMYKSFRTQRSEDIQRRYAAFTYNYIDCRPEDFTNASVAMCCNTKYLSQKTIAFLFNYEQYWLNVYRPFDEYDIESNLSSTHILHGFQWLKGMCRCRKRATRKGRTCRQKCGAIFKYFMDNFCNICVVATTVLFMFALLQTSERLSGNSDAFLESVIYETNNTAYYGICSDSFGDLNVLDVTVLTQLAYEADNYDLCQVIEKYFDGAFELIKIHREEPFYFHIRHRSAPIDFIVIRGTDNVLEMMQDLSLFVEVSIFEGLQWIVPFLNGFPVSFVRQIIYYASYIEGVINSDSRTAFDSPVIEYARAYLGRLESNCSFNSDSVANSSIQDWNGPTSLYFVGHSLGGAIAQIVAANLYEDGQIAGVESHIQSFGVCTPGVLLSSAKFGFGVEALDKTSSSLLPRRDVVSMVDSHGGSVQYTECSASSMLQCHMMDNVLCELFYGCPEELAPENKRGWLRDFCDTSQDGVERAQIGKSMRNDGVYVDEITDLDFDIALEQCDNGVYDVCSDYEDQMINDCWIDFGEYDFCYSEAVLGLDVHTST